MALVNTQPLQDTKRKSDLICFYFILINIRSVSHLDLPSKQQAPHPGARTPFDCCALSFQPFDHPVCARNADGTGNVFDLVNIIPWLKYVVTLDI